ncbi:hypothetical protein [Methanobacterium petrolearium]|uniref:hypothetical protein n=1 Tax=Methanobacterium petrolearium TaxID=710190 RepID=UPI001AE134DD|nr:hypothetical protein [Methanobacterium petrolearium]MBP1946914.1 hypothetical protein [Methanobacterium petrolearium]
MLVVLAFVGGYFTGILNSAGNLTLNITNNSDDTASNDYEDGGYTYYRNTQNTAVEDNTPTTDTNTQTPTNTPKNEPTNTPTNQTT